MGVMFIKVKCYVRGFHGPAEDYVLNIGQIVSFYQRDFKSDDGKVLPYVNLETIRCTVMVAGTMDELFATMQEADTLLRKLTQPYLMGA